MTPSLKPPTPLWDRARRPLLETQALETSRLWLSSGAWGLLMLGGVGRGKSLAAAWLWHRLRDEALAVASRPAGTHADSGRPIYRRAGDTLWLRAREVQRLEWAARSEVLGRCATAAGLVLDEMGAEDERVSAAIGDVLEQRGDARLRTVMTSNLGGGAFLKRYGDRLTSRLRAGGVTPEGGAQWAVLVQGEDMRGKDVEPTSEEPRENEDRKATPDFMAKILSEEAPEVAAMLGALVRRTSEAP